MQKYCGYITRAPRYECRYISSAPHPLLPSVALCRVHLALVRRLTSRLMEVYG